MKRILVVSLATLSIMPWAVHSKDNSIESRAQEEFRKCEVATKRDRDRCNFGGCAAIQRICYDTKLDFIASKANNIVEKMENPECRRLAAGLDNDIKKITDSFADTAMLDSTWSGLEIKISAEVFRYKALSALNQECERR